MTPRRLPRRVARRPTGGRGALGDVDLQPVGGAERHRRLRSMSSQVVTERSATWTRTWGSPVRAVAFQSSWRTSSPGRYARICASSVPRPSAGVR
jgi:hypothetical protein